MCVHAHSHTHTQNQYKLLNIYWYVAVHNECICACVCVCGLVWGAVHMFCPSSPSSSYLFLANCQSCFLEPGQFWHLLLKILPAACFDQYPSFPSQIVHVLSPEIPTCPWDNYHHLFVCFLRVFVYLLDYLFYPHPGHCRHCDFLFLLIVDLTPLHVYTLEMSRFYSLTAPAVSLFLANISFETSVTTVICFLFLMCLSTFPSDVIFGIAHLTPDLLRCAQHTGARARPYASRLFLRSAFYLH